MSTQVPATSLQLRSLVKADQRVELFLEAVDVPEPGPGEVVVRVEASPINPSDLGLLLAGARYDKGIKVVHTGRSGVVSMPHIAMTIDALAGAGVEVGFGAESRPFPMEQPEPGATRAGGRRPARTAARRGPRRRSRGPAWPHALNTRRRARRAT